MTEVGAASTDIGFIGLGQMGSAMAERLEGPKVRLHVHDPAGGRAAAFEVRGARVHASARGVADAASLVFACLPSPGVSLGVAREAAEGGALSTYVETSTIGRAAAVEIESLLAPRGIALVDAPVSGGPRGAREGGLSAMAAGAPSALASALPWLERIAGAVFVVGAQPGLGQAIKLANNLLAATNLAASVEALAAAGRAGVEAQTALDVFNASSGRNSATSGLWPAYLADPDATYGATLATMLKDVELALADVPDADGARVGRAVAEQWRRAVQRLGGDLDILAFPRLADPVATALRP